MKKIEKIQDIGVIIGRFQIHRLHDEHRDLFEKVIARHKKIIVFLGVGSAIGTRKDPMDFAPRAEMIKEEYGQHITAILPLKDIKKSDEMWSKQIDEKVREVFSLGSVVLYGGRDSFIPYYKGIFDTCELEAENKVSATQIRKEVSNNVEKNASFRAGMIYAAYNTYSHVYPTVDVAIMRNEDDPKKDTEVLLGRKPYEKEFRFVGGFTDVTDSSYEAAARREVCEETGVEVSEFKYLCSTNVNDKRYEGHDDRAIMTTFFKATYIYGEAKAKDDIIDVKWFKLKDLTEDDLVTEHKRMLNYLNTTPIA